MQMRDAGQQDERVMIEDAHILSSGLSEAFFEANHCRSKYFGFPTAVARVP
jgi:hypothetical protein